MVDVVITSSLVSLFIETFTISYCSCRGGSWDWTKSSSCSASDEGDDSGRWRKQWQWQWQWKQWQRARCPVLNSLATLLMLPDLLKSFNKYLNGKINICITLFFFNKPNSKKVAMITKGGDGRVESTVVQQPVPRYSQDGHF